MSTLPFSRLIAWIIAISGAARRLRRRDPIERGLP
jgi:hypothetical protein